MDSLTPRVAEPVFCDAAYLWLGKRCRLVEAVFSATGRIEAGELVKVSAVHTYPDRSQFLDVETDDGRTIGEVAARKCQVACGGASE